jgi:hypothetical protein
MGVKQRASQTAAGAFAPAKPKESLAAIGPEPFSLSPGPPGCWHICCWAQAAPNPEAQWK